MFWDRQLHALIPNNPIVVRDLRHQQRTTSFWRGFAESVGIVAVALCVAAAMLYLVLYKRDNLVLTLKFQPLAWIFHTIVVFRSLASGLLVVARDGYFLQSDELNATPLSSWQVVSGKWWTAIHQVRGWMLALGIVQLGVIVAAIVDSLIWTYQVILGLCLTNAQCNPYDIYTYLQQAQKSFFFSPLYLLLVPASVIMVTVLETLCCTAIGVAIALIVRSRLGLVYAVFLRCLPVFIFSIYPDFPNAFGAWENRSTDSTWFSLADGGTGALVKFTWGLTQANSYFLETGLLALGAAAGMFLLYISLLLVTAWAVMRRSRR